MSTVVVIDFDAAQIELLKQCTVDVLAALIGLLDKLESLHGSKPSKHDIRVPGSIDLPAILAELQAMSPAQRAALAADARPLALDADGDIATADASLYTATLIGPGDETLSHVRKRRPVERYRSRRVAGGVVAPATTPREPKTDTLSRYRSISQKIDALKKAMQVDP